MDWLNIHVSTLDSEAFVGAEPVDRATWLCLMRFCCGQENGGVIPQAREWSDRKWQQVCRVTLEEVVRECALWSWTEDGSLRVNFYPEEKEREVKTKRVAGKETARKRWDTPTTLLIAPETMGASPANSPADSSASSSATSSADAEGEGKGREGERKGNGKGTGATGPLASPDGWLPETQTRPSKRDRLRSILVRYGCSLSYGRDDIFPEWCNVVDHYPLEWIEELMGSMRMRAHMPSGLRKILKDTRGVYEAWSVQHKANGATP